MRPEIFALITAMAWGFGGYFEKRGLHLGNLTPQVGITIRTAVALVILAIVSFPQWKSIPEAGSRSLLMMIIGGGVVAGSVGMLSFYAAIHGADSLTQVMPIAFTSPLFSAILELVFQTERLSWQNALGMVLTIGGIIVLTTSSK
jgi:transporter family protein